MKTRISSYFSSLASRIRTRYHSARYVHRIASCPTCSSLPDLTLGMVRHYHTPAFPSPPRLRIIRLPDDNPAPGPALDPTYSDPTPTYSDPS